jgi:hypothetical protein
VVLVTARNRAGVSNVKGQLHTKRKRMARRIRLGAAGLLCRSRIPIGRSLIARSDVSPECAWKKKLPRFGSFTSQAAGARRRNVRGLKQNRQAGSRGHVFGSSRFLGRTRNPQRARSSKTRTERPGTGARLDFLRACRSPCCSKWRPCSRARATPR